jgi:hypothetical protein
MNDRDTLMLNEAYAQIYSEGLKDTLGAVALAVLGILTGKAAVQGVQHSMDEYSKGLPSLQAPDDMTARRNLDKYLDKVGMIKVALAPKHVEALQYIAQHAPDQQIRQRAEDVLGHQDRIAHQH